MYINYLITCEKQRIRETRIKLVPYVAKTLTKG